MARQVLTSVENSFLNGFVTEATGLNFPENAVTDCANVVFDNKGEVTRRLGFDFESPSTPLVYTPDDKAVHEYVWEAAGGDGDNTILVQQIGRYVHFFLLSNPLSVSANLLSTSTIDLVFYSKTVDSSFETIACDFAYGNGHLFVVHPFCEPFYCEYDPDTQTVQSSTIIINTRDTVGIEGEAVGRLGGLTAEHWYNLINQGWTTDLLSQFAYTIGVYPSDYDVWWLFKNADEEFKPRELGYVTRGNSLAPKGFNIIYEWYKDRSALTGVAGLPVQTSGANRPSTIAFFAGRVWYSGVNAQGFNNRIYFSQIADSADKYGRCHQAGDPTSEYSSDLLPNDGGVIVIPEIGQVYKLWPIDSSMIVFASNGVWAITGSQGIGFTATDYSIKSISNLGVFNKNTFCNVGGYPVWWASDAVYQIKQNTVSGGFQLESLTDQRIKKFYTELPEDSKKYAKGVFNFFEKRIHWLYSSEAPSTVAERFQYDRILTLNTQTGAFSIYTFDTSQVKISGIVSVGGSIVVPSTENVLDNLGVPVLNNASANVTVDTYVVEKRPKLFKYLVRHGNNWHYAEEKDVLYRDWLTPLGGQGSVYESYLVTGYVLRGEGNKKWQRNYINVYSRTEEESIVNIQGRWDFANTAITGRWSTTQKLRFVRTNYDYDTRRVKIRGHGKALQLKLTADANEPFHIVGWSSFDTVNQGP
jgi:hypothetical protein